jgi:hypothetical protein
MLGRCVLFVVRRNYTTLQPWPFGWCTINKPYASFTVQVANFILPTARIPAKTFPLMLSGSVCCVRVGETNTTLQPWPFEELLQATDFQCSFWTGGWCTTERILHRSSADVEAVVIVCFREVRRNYILFKPLFGAFTVQPPFLKLRFRCGYYRRILHTIQDLSL